MGGKSSTTTVGYKFYAGASLVLATFIHKLLRVEIGDKLAWEGTLSAEGTISINKPELFGTNAEGGVVGTFAFQPGLPDQMPDSYLISKLGADISANRGVSQLILRQPYMGNTPYLKDITVRGERVHYLDDGSPQWYDEKAPIPNYSETSLNLCFVLDASGSMLEPVGDSTRWQISVDQIKAALDALGSVSADLKIGLVLFGTTTGYPSTMFREISTLQDIEDLKQYLDEFTVLPDGDTNWANGMLGAQDFFIWSGEGSPIILFTTDGQPGTDTDGPQPVTDDAVAIRNEIAGVQLSVFNIDLASLTYSNQLDNTGGAVVVDSSGSGELTSAVLASLTEHFRVDLNFAHMIRECLLNPVWGYGYDESDLDDASFTIAADSLFNESFGGSYFWNDDTDLDSLITKALKHIDGNLYVNRNTLKWTLSLVRNDYNVEDLIELRDGVEVNSISNYSKPQFLDLINTVTVNYYDTRNAGNGSISGSNAALFLQQGIRVNKSVDYNMCCRRDLAARLLQREIDISSNPLSSCDVLATSAARVLHRGSVFKLTSERYNYNQTVMRVIDISYGDGKTRAVKISCVEDRFAMPQNANVDPEAPVVPPTHEPQALSNRMLIEEPYAMLIRRLGQSAVDTELASAPDGGFVGISAARNDGALTAKVYVDSGAGYEETANLDFCPFGELQSDIGYLDSSLLIENLIDSEEISTAVLFQIDDEIMAFTPPFDGTLTGIKRGVFDTIPKRHSAGAGVFFFENWLDGPLSQYVDGEAIDIKLLPATSQGRLALADAPIDTFEFAGRAYRPYPPGNVQVNGAAFPDSATGEIVLTWAHRNRVQQSDQIIDHISGDIGPEPGVTYNVRWYLNDVLEHSDVAVAGTTVSYTPSVGGLLRIELESERDALISYKAYSLEMLYGSPMEAESGDFITTEDLQPIVME